MISNELVNLFAFWGILVPIGVFVWVGVIFWIVYVVKELK